MKGSIVFWLGRSQAPWDHLTALDTGIGGSEVAALRLTSALAASGHKVIVYADIVNPDAPGCNPRWLPFSSAENLLSCDLLVSSRCISLGPGARDRQKLGKPTWLWMHDLHVGADWGNLIGQHFNKVICLSAFAKDRFCQYYPKVDPLKVDIIPNGIYPALYETQGSFFVREYGDQQRRLAKCLEPLNFIWSSCPDRGLDRVLDMWPRIRTEFPGARLFVYGDFLTWSSRCRLYGSRDQQLFAQLLSQRFLHLAAEENETGIRFLGKVGQQALARGFCLAHMWFYPTSFEETSCITAMEAQASGTKIVCTRVGALPYTAPHARFLSDWAPTKIWENEAIEAIRQTLAEPPDPLQGWKAPPSWDQVAEMWNANI